MGRPDQGNKAPTVVGYSHDTGVSTGGSATAVLGVVARDTPGVHGVVLGLRRRGAPWECYKGLRGRPAGPGSAEEYAVATPLKWLTPRGRKSGRLEARGEEERHAEWSGGWRTGQCYK